MADIRSKALGYLRSGAVTVGNASLDSIAGADRPVFVAARVQGHNRVLWVHLLDGRWTCSCQAVLDDGQECAHRAAVALVTGHETAARKPVAVAS